MKKMFLAGASLLVLSAITPALTNDADKVVNATGNLLIDTINKRGIFEWIRGGIGYTDKTLNLDITAFSNLSETKDTVTYIQTSYNRQKSTNRLNLGLGYRKLIDTTATPLIVGVNAFIDSKDGTRNILAFKASENFQRFSVGAELKTARFGLSANLYRPIGNNIIDDKKVLRGWDITAKGNIPNYEQVSVGVNTYEFDGVEDTVVKGNKLLAEFRPNPVITIRGEYDKPSGESAQTDISVDFKLAFGKPIQDQLQSAPVSGASPVWHKRYDKVERHYDIKTAEVDSTPVLGNTLSAADKTANKISAGDGVTEQTAYALQNGEQYDVADFIGNIPDSLKTTAGVIDPNKVTVTVEKVGGDGVKSTDYELYASDGSTVIALEAIQADSQLKDIVGVKSATLKLTYSADGFENRVVYVQTDSAFTGSLIMANLVVPYASGTVTVSTAEILDKLTVSGSQTQKSDWTVKSLADTDDHGNLTVNGKTLTVSGTIGTPTTVTVVFEHDNDEYADQTKTFELSTGAGTLSSGTRTGLSGKWGKTFAAADYKLKTSDTVGDVAVTFTKGDTSNAGDFRFSILPNSDGDKGGKTATTAGIVTGSLTGAINANTGSIDGTKLTKSGTLLVKIVRVAKDGLPEITEYENITVHKQTQSDHTSFTVSASPITWATASTAVTYTAANAPADIGMVTYTLTPAGTTAGTAITVASSDGKIAKTTQSGVVKVKVTYAANDKYEAMTHDIDVAVNKRTTIPASIITAAKIIVPYIPDVSGTKAVSTDDILDGLFTSGSAKSDWSVKSLAGTDSKITIANDKKSMTIIGKIATPITITVVLTSVKYEDITKTFALSTRAVQVIDGTPTGLTGKWGKGTVTPDYKLDLTDQGQTFVKATDYTFSVVSSNDGGKGGKDATTAGIFSSNPISNAKTGAIDSSKLTKSGKLLIKIVRAAKGTGANAVAAATDYVNFDVTKQVLGTDVTTIPTISNGGDNKWKTGNAKFDLTYSNLPGGLAANAFTWAVAGKTGAVPSGTLAIDADGKISGATSSGTVVITLTAKGDKYSGSLTLADFAIAKQTATDSLSMADLVISYASRDGNRTVTTAEILGQLSVSGGQTQKSEWTLASVANTDNNGDLAVTGSGKTLTISDEITTKTTVTAVFSHPAYADKTATFELSTEPSKISTGGRIGSGKWGKSYTTNYKLRPSVGSVNFVSTDYTFSIIANGGDDGSGKTQTTAGIIDGDDYTGAINIRTGAIDGTKLTKSGSLLIKIVRAKRGNVDAVTEYQNFTVRKQEGSDHTGFAVTAGAITWNANSQTVSYNDNTNKPAGISTSPTYTLTASGTTAGTPSGSGAITVSSDGKIANTSKSGVVKVLVTYPANDKYETITRNVDVAVNKQAGTGALSMGNLVIPYASGNVTVSTATITGKLSVPNNGLGATSDWTLKSLANTDNNSNITFNGLNLSISGAISTATTITATFASDKYTDKTATFELSTGTGVLSTGDARTGLRGKWGVGFSTAADYKLKLSDTVGDTTATFKDDGTTDDFTFSILPNSDGDKGGKTKTTAGIAQSGAIDSKTGAIDASKLTKSGILLVKIVRKAKGGLPALTEYENITVTKQDSNDHTGFTVSAGAITWNVNSQTVSYNDSTNKPAGISTSPTYTLTALGTTAGTTTGANAITVASSDGKIANTNKSGVVKVLVTYAANDKYETITRNVDVPVNKQNLATALGVNKPTFTLTGNSKWGAKIPLTFSRFPNGKGFGDYDWTAPGKTAQDTPTGTLTVAADGLTGATSGGIVTLTMAAKSNDEKYSGSVALGDITILKQDAPWVVNPKYASATEALKTANRLTKDTFVSMILHGGTDDFALRGPIKNDKVTITHITDISDITNQDNTITAAVIDTTATENIKFQKIGPVTLTGNAGAMISAAQTELQSHNLIGISKVSNNIAHKNKALKLRIQVPADKKYKVFDTTLYFITDATTKAIATRPVGATSRLSAKVWGSAITNADYNLPTSIKVGGQTYDSLTYTFKVTGSTVGGINKDDVLTNGAIAANTTTDSGTITVEITRAAIPGEVAQATQTVTIPVTKKTLTVPVIPDKANVKSIFPSSGGISIKTGDGSSSNPFQLESNRNYRFGSFITPAQRPLQNPSTLKLYITDPFTLQHEKNGRVHGDFELRDGGASHSGLGTQITSFASGNPINFNGVIHDTKNTHPKDKAVTIRLEYTYVNPNPDKYEDVVVNVYIKTEGDVISSLSQPVGATNPPNKPWGSAITNADYKLPRQVDGVSHSSLTYTFKVTGSTVGGVNVGDVLTNGGIATNTTTDSGTITVEITRAAIPNQVAKATQTVTIPVGKKNVADITNPTVASTNAKWKTGGGKIPLSFSGLPSGTTFGDYTWTVAGKTAATTPTGNMSVASDGLIGATSGGTVILTMKAKSNDDKYSGSVALGDLTIAKQDAPWVVNPKYASATEALKTANRLTKDTDASMILHGGTADFALRGPIANDKVTVTPITNISDITNQDNTITAAVIDTTATENIKFRISGSPPVTLTGTAGAIIAAMQKELQSDKLVGIRKVSDNRAHKDKALKLRIQVPADKKYTAFDETLYFVTSSTTKAIGTQPVGATPTLPARVWGSAITNADYNLPTSIKVGGQTYNSLTYTFKVTGSTVGGVNKDDVLTNGAIAANTTTDSGTITVQITRAAIPGEVAQATQTVTIPVVKKTLASPTAQARANVKAKHGDLVVASGDGSSSSPFQLANNQFYDLNVFVKSASTPLTNPTKIKLYYTAGTLQHEKNGRVHGDFELYDGVGSTNSGSGTQITSFASGNPINFNGVIHDAKNTSPKDKAITIRLEYTYVNPNPDKYEDVAPVNVYIKTQGDVVSSLSQPVGATNPPNKPWGSAITTADYKLPRQVGGVSHSSLTYTFKVTGSTVGGVNVGDVLTNGGIATNTTTDSGTITVEITRAAIPNQVAKATQTVTIPVGKKNVATDVTKPTVSSTNAKWKTGGGKIPLAFSGLPTGTTFGNYTWTVTGKTNDAPDAIAAGLGIAADGLTGAISGGTVVITMKAKSNDDKYTGQVNLADFSIAKQTATDTLSMADLVISYASGDGNRTVTTAEILGQLSVSGGQTQKSEWTLVSVADTDNNGDLAVTGGGKTLTISDEIPTKTTVTAVLSHPAYENKTVTFELSTDPSQISTGARSGSGKWGSGADGYTTDYKLRGSVGSVTFAASDYTFSIIASGGDDGSGLTQTTTGIVDGDDYTGAINIRTGKIDGDKLTKSGTLLVKIVRAAKGTGASRVNAVTEYQNFTVGKQDKSDHPNFLVTVVDVIPQWASSRAIVAYRTQNEPSGTELRKFSVLPMGTTAGPTTGANAVAVQPNVGAPITNITRAGVVKVRVTYAANAKYETMTFDLDVPINKQTVAANTLTVKNLVVMFSGTRDKTVSTADVLRQLSVSGTQKSDWTLKSLAKSASVADDTLEISTDKKSMTVKKAITAGTAITAVFESTKYTDVTKTFTLSTTAGATGARPPSGVSPQLKLTTDTPTGSGIWGKSYTTDYKLNLNNGQFDKTTDYTFSIVAAGGNDGSGKTPTTAGIIDGNDYTGAINSRTGAITATKLTQSGTLLIKIVRAKSGTTTVTEYYNLTVGKQELAIDITKPTLGIPSGTNNIWRDGGGNIPIDFNGLPSAFDDYAWTVAGKQNDAPDTTGAGLSITSSGVMGALSGGTVVVTMKAKSRDVKYQGQVTFDFAIGKQTIPSPLSIAQIAKLYTTGNVTVSEADIRAQLSVSGKTQKADWTLKSLSVPQGTTNLAVDSGGKSLTISGAIGTPTGVTATFTHKKYTDVQTSFKVFTQARSMFTQIPTGTGKWGMSGDVLQTYTTNYYLDTTGGFSKGTQTRRGNYTFEIVPSGTRVAGFTSTTSGIVRGNGYSSTINANTGDIAAFNLTRGGTLLIKITRDALSASVPQLVAYQNFTVGKQELGVDRLTSSTVTKETGEDGKWKSSSSDKIDLKYPSSPTDIQFDWTVARKSGNHPTGTLQIDNAGDISGATSGGTVVTTITAKASDPKYEGKQDYEFTIGKQTTTDTLAFDALIVPEPSGGPTTVTYADILQNLKVTGANALTKASEWTVKKVTVPGNLPAVEDLPVFNRILVKLSINTAKAITITLEHPAYADKDVNIDVSTKANPISTGVRSGSGKWGAGQTYSTDYKLKTSGTVSGVTTAIFNKNTDYTFSIVTGAVPNDAPAGTKATTAGIATAGAIGAKTGAIDASKLTKSGTLLVKIVRAAKGGINATTEYQNFTVSKQDKSDHTYFRVTADALAWSGGVEEKVTYKGINAPAGISDSPTYSLITVGTTAGTVTGDGVGAVDVESDGAISGTRASGIVKVKVTYPANDKYETMDLTVDVPITRRAGLTVAESAFKVAYARSVKWGGTISPTVTGTMPKSPHDLGPLYVPRYSITSRTSFGTTAIGGTINQGTGVITNTQSSGTMVVTVEHPRNIRYEAGTSKDITVAFFPKPQEAAANAGHGRFSTGANGTPTISDISSNYKDIRAYGGVLGGIRPTLTINDSGKYPVSGARYQFDYALFKDDGTLLSPSQAVTEFNSGNTIRIGLGSNPRSDKAIELVFKFPASPDGKYGNKDLSVYWRTTSATPTTTDTLSFDDFVVTTAPAASGGVNVPSADILKQLKVSGGQTQKSQWTIKKITVPNTAQGVSLISAGQGINVNDNLGTATLTITLGHPSYKDKDVTMKVSKRLNPISTGTRSGSGKWGAGQTYTTDYKLKTSLTGSGGSTVTFNQNTDYDFEIVTGAVPNDAPSGTQATTTGIATTGAIGVNTGAIDASKLTKSGTLLVKIVRAAKGGINQTTEYQNFIVSKQDKSDHTNFSVTADAIAWSGGSEKKVTYKQTNTPAGISNSPTYSLITAGTTAGTVTGDGVGSANVKSDGSISGTRASGIVKVKVTYPANDKYETMDLTVDVPITRRAAVTVSESTFKIAYGASRWGQPISPTLTGTMPKSPHDGGPLYVPRYSITSWTNAGTTNILGKINKGTGVITGTQSSGTLVVTIEHPRNIRYEAGVSKDITLTIRRVSLGTATNPGNKSATTSTTAISDDSSKYKDILKDSMAIVGTVRPTVTIQDSSTHSGGARYQFDYALFKDDGTLLSPSQAVTEFNSGNTIRIGLGSNPVANRYIGFLFKFPDSPDGKYSARDVQTYWRTQLATPTTTDTLSFDDFVVTTAPAASGGVNVPYADILKQLKVSGGQTQKSQWTIKKITVPANAQGISLISAGQGINVNDNLGTATLTITLGHPSYKDKDVTMKVSKRLNPISTGTRSGSGKWGAGQTYTTDYKLKTSLTGSGGSTVTFNQNTDYTFSILTGTPPSGYTATTAGIATAGAIGAKTGAIDASKLTKSGTLLVRIVRVAKGGINQATEYQNFTVDKRTQADHTNFKVTADAIAWSGGVEEKVTYKGTNTPAGISDSPTYSLITAGTTAGTVTGDGVGIVDVKSNGSISGTRASGIVKVKATYPANDKYETMVVTVDVPIKRRPAVMVAESAFKVAYSTSRWGVAIPPTVTGTMPKSPHDGGTLYVPRYSITSRTNAGTTAIGGNINQGTGVITGTQSSGTMVVTVEHPRNIRYEAGVSKDISLTIQRVYLGTATNPGNKSATTSTTAISDDSSKYKDILKDSMAIVGTVRPTVTIQDSTTHSIGARYQSDYALFKDDGTLLSPSQAVTEFNSGNTIRIGLGSNPVANRYIGFLFKFPDSPDGKYSARDVQTYWRTQLATPTTTDTLSFNDFVIPTVSAASGGVNVTSADILTQLKVSGGQTQKSQWTIKKITVPANTQGISVFSAGRGINVNDNLGTAILTITLAHPSYREKDVTLKVFKRLSPISTGTRSGSGKWGVGTYSTDYKLKTSLTGSGGSTITFNKNTDYTFEIVTGAVPNDAPSGTQATTAGIVAAGAIGAKTGAIDASKLTKSGTLLVKIVRAAKGGIDQTTEYQNFTVSKQDKSDHTNFKITADALAWSGGVEEKVTYKETNAPAGISNSPTYSLIKVGTTAGTVTGDGVGAVDVESDGAISGTRASGIVKVKVTYPTNDKYEKMDLMVDVPIKRRPGLTVSESAFKVAYNRSYIWGATISPTVTGTMPKSPHDLGPLYVPKYSITSRTNAGTTAIGGVIDQGTGVITGTQSSGTMVVTVEHPRNIRYEAGRSKDITIRIFAKPQEAAANAGHGRFSTGANGTPTISDISSNYKDIRAAYGGVLGGVRPTLTINDSGKYPVSGARYQFDYALFKDDGTLMNPSQAVTEFNSGKTIRIGQIKGNPNRSDKAIELLFKFPASPDGKYGNKDLSIYWRTQLATPTTTDTLSFDDFVVTTAPAASGGVNVPSADILTQLKVSSTGTAQTQKSQWTIKKITVPNTAQGVSVISGGQGINVNDNLGTATLTMTLGHPSYKDKDVTMKVSKRLNPISTGTRSGSGKWGAGQTYSTDYKLKTSLTGSGGSTVTFNKNTDYTFEIVTGAVPNDAPAGTQATTAGIIANGQTAITSRTGTIDASKLTKSGILLVRIVRAAKGGINATTEYQNFTVSKQDKSDHTNFKITADALAWSGGVEKKVTYKETSAPVGISDSPTYSLIKVGTTAGTVTGDGAGSVGVKSNGAISGTRASGIVKVKATYPANDKYETMVVMVDVPIKRRPAVTVSESTFKVAYSASRWGQPISPTLTGTMPKSPHDGGPLYIPRYSIKSRTNAGATAIGGVIDQGTGVITGTQSSGTMVVTVEHPRNIRYEAGISKDIPLTISKQDKSDHTNFRVTADAFAWSGGVEEKVTYKQTNAPAGISNSPTYSLITVGTTAGTVTGDGVGIVDVESDGAISGTRASGIVKVKVTYPANDKYEKMDLMVDVPIKRRPALTVSESAFKVAYNRSYIWGTTITPTVTGTMPQSPHDGGPLYVPKYSITSRTNAGTTAIGGVIDQGTGVITGTQSSGTLVVTVENPRNIRYEAGISKDITLTIRRVSQGATIKPGHGTATRNTPAISDDNTNYDDIRAYAGALGGVRPTLTINDSGKYPATGARYQLDYALFKDDGTLLTPSQVVTEFNSGTLIRIGQIKGNPNRSNNIIEILFKFPASLDGKYDNKDLLIYWRTP